MEVFLFGIFLYLMEGREYVLNCWKIELEKIKDKISKYNVFFLFDQTSLIRFDKNPGLIVK